MHFTYDESLCQTELMQGDVLKRTPEIEKLLKNIHPHFYHNSNNSFFIVLTQSCDLVPRGTEGICKAPYISIAPVRTLDLVVESYLAQLGNATFNAELPVLSSKSKAKASEFLQRLFNNNEQGYLFLDSLDTPLPTDCVAFLNLSIAIKSDLHYKDCLNAKVLQLTDTFQAKLGWLVGQMYSRVGTRDWDSVELKKKVKGILNDDAAIWVDDDKLKALESGQHFIDSAIKKSRADIARAIKAIPVRKKQILDQVEDVITGALKHDNKRQIAAFRKRLESEIDLNVLLLNQHEKVLQNNEQQTEIESINIEIDNELTTFLKQQILNKAVGIFSEELENNQPQLELLRKRLDNDQSLKTFLN